MGKTFSTGLLTNAISTDSSNNVGIGTASPTTYSLSGKHLEVFGGSNYSFLHVNTTTVKSFLATNESALIATFFTFSNHPLAFGTNNTERMRITSAGNVGIATSSPSTNLTINDGGGSKTNSIDVIASGNSTKGHIGQFNNKLYISSNWFYNGSQNADSTSFGQANIVFDTQNASTGTNINFGTSEIGSTVPIERVRITTSGRLEVKSEGIVSQKGMGNNVGGGSFLAVSQSVGTEYWYLMQLNTSAGLDFWNYNSSWNVRANLSSAGVWYSVGGGTSDKRTKQNIEYIETSGLDAISLLKPTKFEFIACPDKTRRGFIAQDVLEVIPDLVLGDGELENVTYGLDYDCILALAVKAIQELKAELDALKNK